MKGGSMKINWTEMREHPRARRIDHVMQWGYRDHFGMAKRCSMLDDFLIVVIGNMACAFNGDRLVLARAR